MNANPSRGRSESRQDGPNKIRDGRGPEAERTVMLVHQVSDWCSGVAIKMGRRQGGPSRTGTMKEPLWIET
jgi:hypothetical protein